MIVDCHSNTPVSALPFTLVAMPDDAPETEDDFFGDVDHLMIISPKYIRTSTHIDHIIWAESKKSLSKKNRSWPKRFTQREILNADGTMQHVTLMKLMCSMLQVRGSESADDVLDILKRCSDHFQHRIVRLGQSKKKSTNAEYIHHLVNKYTSESGDKK